MRSIEVASGRPGASTKNCAVAKLGMLLIGQMSLALNLALDQTSVKSLSPVLLRSQLLMRDEGL
jgi:hypothetical protein